VAVNREQQQAADLLRATLGYGDRRIADALGLSRKIVRGDRERRAKALVGGEGPPAGPRVLLYDIETAPALVWVWHQYQTNVVATEQDWYLLSFAWRWLGSDHTGFVSIFQDPEFTPDTSDDRFVAEHLATLFDQADVTVAHNGDKFDKRKANARFLFHGIDPPSPYQTVDTKKEAQRYFANYSNALTELGRLLGIGEKEKHRGFSLWRDCMRGDSAAWAEMEGYNRRDLDLLEALYLRLLPWVGHPGSASGANVGLWQPEQEMCPKCGGKVLIRRGTYRTRFSEYPTFQCVTCRGFCRGRFRERGSRGPV